MAIEQLYDLQLAANLIPYPYQNLKWWLNKPENKHRFPPRYRRKGRNQVKVRLLRESEVLAIRQLKVINP